MRAEQGSTDVPHPPKTKSMNCVHATQGLVPEPKPPFKGPSDRDSGQIREGGGVMMSGHPLYGYTRRKL